MVEIPCHYDDKSTENKGQQANQKSEEFKSKAKSRYKIEAENSELKHMHGCDVAASAGLFGMHIKEAKAYNCGEGQTD